MVSRAYTKTALGAASKASKPANTGASLEYMASIPGIKHVNSSTPVSPQSTKKKRKSKAISYSDDDEKYLRDAYDDNDEVAEAAAQAALAGIDESKPKRARKKKDEEKRLRRFRVKAPATYLERLNRVKTQKMFLIDRTRTTSDDGTHEEEVFDIAGTTGNIYQVTISKEPTCSCPDGGKGNQCKHIIYVSLYLIQKYQIIRF